jgi:hypothetical protein
MHVNSPGLRPLLLGVLAAALLLGQVLALGHLHDANQVPGDNCVLCLYAQHLDSVDTTLPIVVLLGRAILPVPDAAHARIDSSCFTSYQSRAPPTVLL